MSDFSYEVVGVLGVLSQRDGWSKEVRLVKWNGRNEKVDIREWATDDSGKMSKGITLTKEELLLMEYFLSSLVNYDEKTVSSLLEKAKEIREEIESLVKNMN